MLSLNAQKKCPNPSNLLVDYCVMSRNFEYTHGYTQIEYLCRKKKILAHVMS